MAKSKFEYVKGFELNDALMPETYLVVRIDGRGFHKCVMVDFRWCFYYFCCFVGFFFVLVFSELLAL